jgi:DNA-binding NarL/FixJ family response regulator
MSKVRVLIVDDHAILRDGIRSLLERQDEIEVVGEAENGQVAVERAGSLLPDIVLMDVAMPVMNGLEATLKIKELYPNIKVLILTQHDNQEYVEPLLKAGASGYVLKRSGGREVVTAIRYVHEQGAFLEPSIHRQVLDGFQQIEESRQEEHPSLTNREKEILRMIFNGKSTKEIALHLNISPKTVSVHRSNVMAKLDVHTNFELIRYIDQHGLDNLHP